MSHEELIKKYVAQAIALVREYAFDSHASQVDQAGEPYVGHLARVHEYLVRRFPDASYAEQCAAYLHDIVEDGHATYENLSDAGISDTTLDIIRLVSRKIVVTVVNSQKSVGNEPYSDFIDRIVASGNQGAIRVKIADLLDNTDPRRLAALPIVLSEKLSRKYLGAIERLESALVRSSV